MQSSVHELASIFSKLVLPTSLRIRGMSSPTLLSENALAPLRHSRMKLSASDGDILPAAHGALARHAPALVRAAHIPRPSGSIIDRLSLATAELEQMADKGYIVSGEAILRRELHRLGAVVDLWCRSAFGLNITLSRRR